MVRNYKKKCKRFINEENLKIAIKHVFDKTVNLREAAGVLALLDFLRPPFFSIIDYDKEFDAD